MERIDGEGLFLVAFLSDRALVHRVPAGCTVTVGRGVNADVQVMEQGLSRAHFTLHAGSAPIVRDLGSVNGTRVAGVRLTPNVETPVEIGTVIDAGGTFFVLRDRDPHTTFAEEHGERLSGSLPAAMAGVVVEDPTMTRLYGLVSRVARSSIPVIVTGETGVGKELVATALHTGSPRGNKPFIRINCAAVPEQLLESELFGFERGAFTGATQSKRGLIESADGSSFLLDEIGEVPLGTQAKLLRVLETGEIMRLGALAPRTVDVRFIAATNRDLPALVAERAFRADLYYRLNGITIAIPPLRERVAEVSRLATHFLSEAAKRVHRRAPRLSGEAIAMLESHSWPGNVRELRNVMDRALMMCRGDVVGGDGILLDPVEAPPVAEHRSRHPPAPSAAPPVAPPAHAKARSGGASARGRLVRRDRDTECAMIQKALEDAGGHQGRAAELLGISRRTLINRLEEYGLARPRKR
jgi:transcriptional regulator with PAS, ATPase and Fis domain